MRSLSFFAVAVIATVSLAVSGCGGETSTTPAGGGGGGATTTTEGGSQSSTTPATGDTLTSVSFDVTGMT